MSSNSPDRTHFRIGLLGGMGPEAGVLLQQLIIEATPAQKDQDHLEVIAYTNPHVPDRTESLKNDGGESYLRAVIRSLQLLEGVGVDVLVIACNTAHARIGEIRESIRTPFVNIVELARAEIAATPGTVGIMATDGTVGSGLFSIPGDPPKSVVPPPELQAEVMRAIRDIKKRAAGEELAGRLAEIVAGMRAAGCAKLLLGCTELSIYHDELSRRLGNIFIDPMRLAARRLVELATAGG